MTKNADGLKRIATRLPAGLIRQAKVRSLELGITLEQFIAQVLTAALKAK